jgi:hypothetical protein
MRGDHCGNRNSRPIRNFKYCDSVTLFSVEMVADFQQARLFAGYAGPPDARG